MAENEKQTPILAALIRGFNLSKESNGRIQSASPPPNEMMRVILAAILNLQEEILARLEALEARQVPFSDPVEATATATAKTLAYVDKPCDTCRIIMEHVHPATKYCPKCKEARR